MSDRLHPASMAELRQLVKLHGVAALRRALDEIEKTPAAPSGRAPPDGGGDQAVGFKAAR